MYTCIEACSNAHTRCYPLAHKGAHAAATRRMPQMPGGVPARCQHPRAAWAVRSAHSRRAAAATPGAARPLHRSHRRAAPGPLLLALCGAHAGPGHARHSHAGFQQVRGLRQGPVGVAHAGPGHTRHCPTTWPMLSCSWGFVCRHSAVEHIQHGHLEFWQVRAWVALGSD